jgi:hypothetical protein
MDATAKKPVAKCANKLAGKQILSCSDIVWFII